VADFLSDGTTRVAYVPAIANINSPTTTELNAGILLQSLITADGLEGLEASTADVPTTALNSLFDTVTIGRDSYSGTMLTLKKQVSGDTAFATLVRGTVGFLAVRRDLAETTAWTSTQPLEVYPVIFGQRVRMKPEGNTVTRWQAPFKITSAPSLSATVA
jgi:hypothetical protein